MKIKQLLSEIFTRKNELKYPVGWKQYVLYMAIKKGWFNHYSIEYYGTSKRVWDLEMMDVNFERKSIWRKNSFGFPEQVLSYRITNKDFAIELYKNLTK